MLTFYLYQLELWATKLLPTGLRAAADEAAVLAEEAASITLDGAEGALSSRDIPGHYRLWSMIDEIPSL